MIGGKNRIMKKTILLSISLIIIVISLIIVFQPSSPADGKGYILEKYDNKVLVVDNIDFQQGDIVKWNDIFETYEGNAIVLTTNKNSLKVGQYVEYWIDGGVNTSFPLQAKAKRIKVIND